MEIQNSERSAKRVSDLVISHFSDIHCEMTVEISLPN